MTPVLDLVGRLACSGCRSRGTALCANCERRLVVPPGGLDVPGVERVIAAFRYEGAARGLVLDLKARGSKSHAGPLVNAMSRAVWREGLRADALTWVPGRARDIRRRGFDHAEILARGLAVRVGIPAVRLIERVSDGQDQVGLDVEQRWINLEGVFTAVPVQGHVAVVDDLVTTGATAAACATALRDAGARRVELVVACRV